MGLMAAEPPHPRVSEPVNGCKEPVVKNRIINM